MKTTKPISARNRQNLLRYQRGDKDFGAVGPWRCMECGVPLVPGRQMPCKCYPNPDKRGSP